MKLKVIFFLLLWLGAMSGKSQFVNFGQDRASLRWKQIRATDFQIIYPDFFEANAQKMANLYTRLYRHTNSLGLHPRRMSVVVHPDGGVSNGNVALAPRKTELYTMPSQEPGDEWLAHLCIHEFRHVVQLDQVNQGLTRGLSYVFGELFPIAVVGVYVPMWFMEGDAVSFETAVGHLGRGRSPEFLNQMKAQVVEKGLYNYSKAVLGSYKHFVPNRYVMGYFMTAQSRIHYGNDIWTKALTRTGRRPFGITPFATSLKLSMQGKRDSLWQDSTFRSLFIHPDSVRQANTYRDAKRTLYRDNFSELQQVWKKEATLSYPRFDSLRTCNKYYTDYYSPTPLSDQSVVAYKKGLAESGSFVRLSGNREKRLTRTAVLDDYHFTAGDHHIAWSEYIPHVRWEQAGRMQLSSYDLQNHRYRTHRSRNNRFSPFAIDKQWGCVETDNNNNAFLVILDSSFRQEIKRIPAQSGEMFIHPSYANGKITTVVESAAGLRLESIDPDSGERRKLTEDVYYELDHPVTSGDQILYRASYNGNNAFYRLSGKDMTEVLTSRYGLRFPRLSEDGKQLFFSYYTAEGYKPGRIALSEMPSREVDYRHFPLAEDLKKQEDWSLRTDADSLYPTRKYNKLTHLVNIHSWGPLYADLYDGDVNIGAVIYSQNKLSTLSFAAGYLLKSGYDHGAWMVKGSYSGWWPIIDVEGESGRYDYLATMVTRNPQTDTTDMLYVFNKARLSEAKVTLRLPFNLSRRQYNRLLQPYVRYEIQAVHHAQPKQVYRLVEKDSVFWLYPADKHDYDLRQKSRYYQLLEYGLTFSNTTRMTVQEINPRWGQVFSGGYTHSPLENMDLGYQWWCDGRLYFPGLARNHSLSLYGGFQHMSGKTRNYSNKILYPRGISLYGYEISSLRTSYQMPLAWPDWAMGSVLYLKSLTGGIFYDFGTSRNRLGKTNYSSYGVEFMADTHFFRLTYPIRLGFRTGYETQQKSMFTDLIFSIGISI